MRKMKYTKRMVSLFLGVAVMVFFACNIMAANEPVSVVSEAATLNTITFTRAVDAVAQEADTRTHTEDWSAMSRLDTRPIVSTIFLLL